MSGVILEAIPSWQMALRDIRVVLDVVAEIRVVHCEPDRYGEATAYCCDIGGFVG
jgi:hypothetical protein